MMNREMANFQKCDFLQFSIRFTLILVASGALYVSIEYTLCFICHKNV